MLWRELLVGAERTAQGPEPGKLLRMQEMQSAHVLRKPFQWRVRYRIIISLVYKRQTDYIRGLVWT